MEKWPSGVPRLKVGRFYYQRVGYVFELVDYQLEVDKGKLTAVANLKS